VYTTKEKLDLVREAMAAADIQAFIIPRADEYLGEYVPEHNERLQWISGFSGSAGMAIILVDRAAIFVDGRYTIQVKQQVSSELYEYQHLIDETPIAWLKKQLTSGRVGIDSRLHSYKWFKDTRAVCSAAGLSLLELTSNPIDDNWHDRPVPERQLATLLDSQFTGEPSSAKRQRIGAAIKTAGANVALITQLDSIAWLLNIRGNDVPRLPVLLATATLKSDGSMTLFTDPAKIPNDFSRHVGDGVTVEDQANISAALRSLAEQNVLTDPGNTNAFTQLRCIEAGAKLIEAEDPVLLPKAQKNPVELQGMRNCHIRDGSAVTRFLHWISQEVSEGRFHDEAVLSDQLLSFREALSDIHDLSFDTISAAGANSAICHYNHMNGKPASISMGDLYLVDSGGQFSDGTTDITRTVAIGEPSDEQRRMFTLVLKGHIALSQAVFPKGTSGVQLDVLARQFLWQVGADYDHGTGHGVGCFLSVHEGPQRITKSGPQQALLPGMVVSNEPGYYQEGSFGIRCENLMAVCEVDNGMLGFETITFAPFDNALVDLNLMTASEINWLNQYHSAVQEKLTPLLDSDDLNWLQNATTQI
jgi:Xaa-Pro aminopeptidase